MGLLLIALLIQKSSIVAVPIQIAVREQASSAGNGGPTALPASFLRILQRRAMDGDFINLRLPNRSVRAELHDGSVLRAKVTEREVRPLRIGKIFGGNSPHLYARELKIRVSFTRITCWHLCFGGPRGKH